MKDNPYTLRITAREEIPQLGLLIQQVGERAGVLDKCIYQLSLALDELVTNMFDYGFDSEGDLAVDVALWFEGAMFVAQTRDNGRKYNCTKAKPPELDIPLEGRKKPVGGMGIHLVKSMMSEFTYAREGDINIITVKKDLSQPCCV